MAYIFFVNIKLECNGQIPGERILTHDKHILMESIEITSSGHKISTRSEANLSVRNMTILNAKIDQKWKRNNCMMFDLMTYWTINTQMCQYFIKLVQLQTLTYYL